MRYLIVAASLASLALLSGCIWGPNNRSDAESSATINLVGYTFNPNEAVLLQANDLTTNTMWIVGSAMTASSTTYTVDGTPMYQWSASIAPFADFWAPQITTAGNFQYSLGRLEIFPTLTTSGESLYTFNAKQYACMNANMLSIGVVAAAGMCGDSTSLVLFDNNGVGTAPTSGGLTRLGSVQTYAVGGISVNWELDSYQVLAGTTSLTVYDLLCTPTTGPMPYPVQIYNHGGYSGLSGDLTTGVASGSLGDCVTGAGAAPLERLVARCWAYAPFPHSVPLHTM